MITCNLIQISIAFCKYGFSFFFFPKKKKESRMREWGVHLDPAFVREPRHDVAVGDRGELASPAMGHHGDELLHCAAATHRADYQLRRPGPVDTGDVGGRLHPGAHRRGRRGRGLRHRDLLVGGVQLVVGDRRRAAELLDDAPHAAPRRAAVGVGGQVAGPRRGGPHRLDLRHRWISDDARGAAGGAPRRTGPAPHPPRPRRRVRRRWGRSRNTAARAVTGRWPTRARTARRPSPSASAPAARGLGRRRGGRAAAAAAHRSSICFRRLGVGSAAAAAAAPPAASWWWWWWWCWWSGQRGRGDCGGGTRMLKNPLAGCLEDALEGSLHGVESCGMAATEDVAMAPPNSQR